MRAFYELSEETREVPNVKRSCPICTSVESSIFFYLPDMPVHIGLRYESRQAARSCPRDKIVLIFCWICGHIWNEAFDPQKMDYGSGYNNSLGFSPTFRKFAAKLASRLIDQYNLREKKIVDIGSGQGHFLSLMCSLGENEGVGFDPGYRPENDLDERITLIPARYSEKYLHFQPDLISCRQVLEHIPDPFSFLTSIRRTIGPDVETFLYLEVPNTGSILFDLSIWDIIYEHCNFFTARSLNHVARVSGFEILNQRESFGSQFLSLEGKSGSNTPGRMPTMSIVESAIPDAISTFSRYAGKRILYWREQLDIWHLKGRKSVVWGAGARATSFFNILDINDEIGAAVDINPAKQGAFIPGTGQPVLAPDELTELQPDVIIVINPLYLSEIENTLEELGLQPELVFA
jgi:hypothetical protein